MHPLFHEAPLPPTRIWVRPEHRWADVTRDPRIPIEVDLSELEGVDVDLSELDAPLVHVEVAVAPYSESNFFEELDGALGVFVATYRDLPIGARAAVTVFLPGDVGFEATAVVAFHRRADGCWPGLGLRFEQLSPSALRSVHRFAWWRPPMLA